MAKDQQGTSLRHIHTLFNVGTIAGLSDGQLLEWYTTRGGEAAELAFSALVERHGPMVLRVCRSLLRDEHEAHDAFQATFLVLVRRASRLWVRDSLGPWLHQVACRVASCARSAAARRRRNERRAVELAAHPSGDEARDDLRPILHEEIGRLPEHFRAAIVLCCLEGLTQEQAARQLGWPLGTVQSRLARGRERLRGRLARRGLALLVGPFCSAIAGERAAAAVPTALIEETTRAAGAIALAAGEAATAGAVSAAAVGLMEGALRTMFLIQSKRIAAIILVLGIATAGAGVLARQPAKDTPASPPRELMKTWMPSYVVEPPDMLLVEVQEALPGKPISGERLVRPDGKISLGYYGEVYVAGLTPLEIKEKVILHLRKHLGDERLGLVMPDPDRPGRSKTVSATDSVRAYVDVTAYNSKNYYVLGEVAAPGRFPITGNDTVLDAINFVGGLLPTASKSNLRLVRPPPGVSSQQVLRVDYSAIVYEGDPATNYQLRPGDRLIVLRDPNAGAAGEEPKPEPAAADLRTPRAETPREEPEPAPATSDLQALNRRLNAVERKLDRVIELLGGPSNPPPAPHADGPTPIPREEQ